MSAPPLTASLTGHLGSAVGGRLSRTKAASQTNLASPSSGPAAPFGTPNGRGVAQPVLRLVKYVARSAAHRQVYTASRGRSRTLTSESFVTPSAKGIGMWIKPKCSSSLPVSIKGVKIGMCTVRNKRLLIQTKTYDIILPKVKKIIKLNQI